jgi:hypothetical protein
VTAHTAPARRVAVIARPCHDCGIRILAAACFDGRTRTFDPTLHTATSPAAVPGARWWLTHTRGMVNDAVTAPTPSQYVALHRCRPLTPAPLADSIGGPRPTEKPAPTGPTIAATAPGRACGYRWPTGPAHVLTAPDSRRALCGAWCPHGDTPRERDRATLMPACPRCLKILERKS